MSVLCQTMGQRVVLAILTIPTDEILLVLALITVKSPEILEAQPGVSPAVAVANAKLLRARKCFAFIRMSFLLLPLQ